MQQGRSVGMSVDVDVVVVGAGVMGSATAYHLANRGASVILIEQVSRVGVTCNETKLVRTHTTIASFPGVGHAGSICFP